MSLTAIAITGLAVKALAVKGLIASQSLLTVPHQAFTSAYASYAWNQAQVLTWSGITLKACACKDWVDWLVGPPYWFMFGGLIRSIVHQPIKRYRAGGVTVTPFLAKMMAPPSKRA